MADFASYITIRNKTNNDITLGESHKDQGTWAPPPATLIKSGESKQFTSKDPTGAWEGSSGYVIYDVTDQKKREGKVKITWDCPYSGDNAFSVGWSGKETDGITWGYKTKIDDGEWKEDSINTDGHPLYAEVEIIG